MDIVEFNGYRLDPRKEFEAAAPESLVTRAKEYNGVWVLWDPNDDPDGFMIVGHDKEELIQDFISHFGDDLVQP